MKTQVYKTLRTFGINLFKKQGLLMLTLAALISVNSLLSQTQSVPFAVTFMGDVVLKGEEENLIPTAIYAVAGSTRTSPLDVMGAGTTIATSDYRAMEWVNDGTAIGTIYV
ncbi:MAG: hypothetical protein FWE63_04230, partial [Bacteroidales bacterium]|nr:hypothetical protein [Bacteroidales bacterium]